MLPSAHASACRRAVQCGAAGGQHDGAHLAFRPHSGSFAVNLATGWFSDGERRFLRNRDSLRSAGIAYRISTEGIMCTVSQPGRQNAVKCQPPAACPISRRRWQKQLRRVGPRPGQPSQGLHASSSQE